jgi:hypothetical protein
MIVIMINPRWPQDVGPDQPRQFGHKKAQNFNGCDEASLRAYRRNGGVDGALEILCLFVAKKFRGSVTDYSSAVRLFLAAIPSVSTSR